MARQDQHTVFRELRTCKLGLNNQSMTPEAEGGTRLTNMKDCLCRLKYHFNDLLNKPCDATDAELQRDAEQATPDADSHTDLVTSREIELCLKRLENRRAPGICSITAELLRKGGTQWESFSPFEITKETRMYSGTSPYGHLTSKKTSRLQSPWLSPKLYSTVQITPCNKVTSPLRSFLPSPVGDLNSEVPLYAQTIVA